MSVDLPAGERGAAVLGMVGAGPEGSADEEEAEPARLCLGPMGRRPMQQFGNQIFGHSLTSPQPEDRDASVLDAALRELHREAAGQLLRNARRRLRERERAFTAHLAHDDALACIERIAAAEREVSDARAHVNSVAGD